MPDLDRATRFLRACRREPVDATPVWFMRQAGRSLPEYRAIRERASLPEIVNRPELCAEVTLQPVERLGVDAAILFADIATPLPGIGIDVRIVEGVGPVIDRPVRERSDLERLRPFEPDEAVGPLLEAIGLIRAASPVPVIGFAGAPFTLASYVVAGRSSSDAGVLKALWRRQPAVVEELLDQLTTMTIRYVGAQVAAGVQAVQIFDSWVGALGPLDYAQLVMPQMSRIFEAIEGLGVPAIHFTTGTAGILDLVATAGGDVIGIDWRVAISDAWSTFPDRAIMGNLEPTLLLGPWEATERRVGRILEDVARRPGHIFNLGHGVPPEADPDHLRRIVDLVHETTAAPSSAGSATTNDVAERITA